MVAHTNLKTQAHDGIVCDLCGSTLLNKFEYFSVQYTLVEVDCDAQKIGAKRVDPRNLELDICPKCMGDITNQVKKTIEQRENKTSWTTKT